MLTPNVSYSLDDNNRRLYLELMKECLAGLVWEDPGLRPGFGYEVIPFDKHVRSEGRDWPKTAYSMIGLKRLNNIQGCVEDVIRDGVKGDLIEAGVWRGGTSIFMRAILKSYDVSDRIVWVADSFAGLPPPDVVKYPADIGSQQHTFDILKVSLEEVQSNFAKYNLLDDQVRFVRGLFKDTLPNLEAKKLAVLRIDADMYESTMDALSNLYHKLAEGGYVVIDDYGAIPACKSAVDDFRSKNGIKTPMQSIDWTGVFWKRNG